MPESMLFHLIGHLASANTAKEASPKRDRFNPRPPGVICSGSATEAVYQILRETGIYMTEGQLTWKTGRSHSAVSWALIRLVQWGKVEKTSDPRSVKYNRYRAVRETGS